MNLYKPRMYYNGSNIIDIYLKDCWPVSLLLLSEIAANKPTIGAIYYVGGLYPPGYDICSLQLCYANAGYQYEFKLTVVNSGTYEGTYLHIEGLYYIIATLYCIGTSSIL